MSKYSKNRLSRQALVSTTDTVGKAIEAAVACVVSVSKTIHYSSLLAFLREQTGLTRAEAKRAIDALARTGRVRIQAVLGCILICDSKTGGAA